MSNLRRSDKSMLYKNDTIVLSSASLVGMDTEMDEDDAEFLEQGVKDDSCVGMDTPDLTSEKAKIGSSQSSIDSDQDESRHADSCNGDHSVRCSNNSNQNLSRSCIDEIPLLPSAVALDAQSKERYLSKSLFSKYESIDMYDDEQQGLNLDEENDDAIRIPQADVNVDPELQTGCISSENQKLSQDVLNKDCLSKSRQQSASQSTSENEPCDNSESFIRESSPKPLQVITEGVEAHFKGPIDLDPVMTVQKCSLPNSKSMDRLLSEAAQFAEALGEIPPSNIDEISRQIIDLDEDDDDDSISAAAELTEDEINENIFKEKNDNLQNIPDESNLKSTQAKLLETSFDDSVLEIESKSSKLERQQKRERSRSMDDMDETNGDQITVITPSRLKYKETNQSNLFKLHSKLFESLSNKKAILEKSLLDGLTPTDEAQKNNKEDSSGYVYRGLKSNPPAITQRGISRGNYAQLHRKAWLEVSDKYHRYGKNLRLYYKHWESLSHPTNMFFDWLDCKGEAAGQPLPNLNECPRSQLDSDTVLYITNPDITERYRLSIEKNGKGIMSIVDTEGNPIETGPEGWIFVLRDGILYAAPKVTSVSGKSKQRFHHSSFFGGKAVAAAGIIITDKNGILQRLYPHSGHYRPGEAHMHRMLFFIQKNSIDLFSFQVDTQQIMHVSRKESPKGGKRDDMQAGAAIVTEIKSKKVNNLHLRSGATVACLLAHKAHMIGYGIFVQIHKIRRMKHPVRVKAFLEKISM